MYAFKVVATTLQMLLIIAIVGSGLKANAQVKRTCCIMLLVCAMSVVAIWG